MNVGYGLNRTEKDLRDAGAEKVCIDTDPKRPLRARMFETGKVRRGDTLILRSIRDLGGSPLADRQWQERCEKMGVEIKIVPNGKETARPAHRPRAYEPNADDRDTWLNWRFTEASRLEAVNKDRETPVSKGVLNRWYGNPSNPKEWPRRAGQ